MTSLSTSLFGRPLVGSARLGLPGLLLRQPALRQPAACSSPFSQILGRPSPLPLASAARSFHLSAPPVFSSGGYDGKGGHGGSSSSRSASKTASPWYLAAAIPLVADATSYETAPPSRRPLSSYSRYDLPLSPEFASEVSKGSVIGFVFGLLVSTFSKSLVLLLGLAITLQSMAARAGIDLVQYFHLKDRFSSSRVLAALSEHTAFKLAFGICFMLSSVMHF